MEKDRSDQLRGRLSDGENRADQLRERWDEEVIKVKGENGVYNIERLQC